jgi:riboflavin synthase
MFSGIIEAIGNVREVTPHEEGKYITISSNFNQSDLKIGDSVAVAGCCLTIIELDAKQMKFYASKDTLQKTNLIMLSKGSAVNLEKALLASSRLGGHLVSGHVDETATIESIETIGADKRITIIVSNFGKNLLAQRGSVTVEGISLTVAQMIGNKLILNIIPHTWENTTLNMVREGYIVNIEFDIIAKHAYKMLKNLINR